MSRTPGVIALGLGLGLALATIPPMAAQDRSGGDPVRLGVTLSTTTDLPVYEVPCDTFEVLANGTPRQLVQCAAGGPVTLAVLLDVSTSFIYDLPIGSLMRDLPSKLRPDDRMAIGWFAGETVPATTFTRDRRLLNAAVDRAARAANAGAGPSPLWDALAATVAALAREPGRRAVIVLTDGQATGNATPFPLTAREVIMSGVELHAIGSPIPGPSGRGGSPERILATRLAGLARASGGTASWGGQRFAEVKPQLESILAGLQRSYLLGFTPEARDDQIHRLEVRIRLPGLILRAPDRYGAR